MKMAVRVYSACGEVFQTETEKRLLVSREARHSKGPRLADSDPVQQIFRVAESRPPSASHCNWWLWLEWSPAGALTSNASSASCKKGGPKVSRASDIYRRVIGLREGVTLIKHGLWTRNEMRMDSQRPRQGPGKFYVTCDESNSGHIRTLIDVASILHIRYHLSCFEQPKLESKSDPTCGIRGDVWVSAMAAFRPIRQTVSAMGRHGHFKSRERARVLYAHGCCVGGQWPSDARTSSCSLCGIAVYRG